MRTESAFSQFEKTELAREIVFTPFEPIPGSFVDLNGFQDFHMFGTYRGVSHESVFKTDTTFGNEFHKAQNEKMARACIIQWFQVNRIKIAVKEAEAAFGGKIPQIMRHDIKFHPAVDSERSDVRVYPAEFMGLKLSAAVNRKEEMMAEHDQLGPLHRNRIEATLTKRFNEVFHTSVEHKPLNYFE